MQSKDNNSKPEYVHNIATTQQWYCFPPAMPHPNGDTTPQQRCHTYPRCYTPKEMPHPNGEATSEWQHHTPMMMPHSNGDATPQQRHHIPMEAPHPNCDDTPQRWHHTPNQVVTPQQWCHAPKMKPHCNNDTPPHTPATRPHLTHHYSPPNNYNCCCMGDASNSCFLLCKTYFNFLCLSLVNMTWFNVVMEVYSSHVQEHSTTFRTEFKNRINTIYLKKKYKVHIQIQVPYQWTMHDSQSANISSEHTMYHTGTTSVDSTLFTQSWYFFCEPFKTKIAFNNNLNDLSKEPAHTCTSNYKLLHTCSSATTYDAVQSLEWF
jgi:hypothetical protein